MNKYVFILTFLITLNSLASKASTKTLGPTIMLSLEQAHKLALQNNPSYQNVKEQIYTAQTYIQSGWTMLTPHLSATGTIIRNRNEIALEFPQFDANTGEVIGTQNITILPKWQQNLNFTANMTLFNSRSIPLIKKAYEMKDQALLRSKITQNELLFAVTSAFYQIANMEKLIEVYQENQKVSEEFLKMAEALNKTGQNTQVDVMRAQIQVTKSKAKVEDALAAYETAKRSLGIFIGIDTNFKTTFTPLLAQTDHELKGLTQTALSSRTEIQSANIDIQMAKRDVADIAAAWIPKLDATWSADIGNASGFSDERVNWMLIFGAHWSIFEGGSRIAERNRRKSAVKIAQHNLLQLELEIKTDINNRYNQLLSKKRNMEVSLKLVELSRENHQMISKQYEVGLASSLDLLSSLTELSNQSQLHIIDTLEYQVEYIALHKAIGDYSHLTSY